jgi:hypothetical protein
VKQRTRPDTRIYERDTETKSSLARARSIAPVDIPLREQIAAVEEAAKCARAAGAGGATSAAESALLLKRAEALDAAAVQLRGLAITNRSRARR